MLALYGHGAFNFFDGLDERTGHKTELGFYEILVGAVLGGVCVLTKTISNADREAAKQEEEYGRIEKEYLLRFRNVLADEDARERALKNVDPMLAELVDEE